MTARRTRAKNDLEEAMALLIRNQAAFVEQISRSEQERLRLQQRTEEWERESRERFSRIEAELKGLPAKIIQAAGSIAEDQGRNRIQVARYCYWSTATLTFKMETVIHTSKIKDYSKGIDSIKFH